MACVVIYIGIQNYCHESCVKIVGDNEGRKMIRILVRQVKNAIIDSFYLAIFLVLLIELLPLVGYPSLIYTEGRMKNGN